MNYLGDIKRTKATIATFQEQTNSNSVLDFCVWLENRIAVQSQEEEIHKRKK